MIRDDYRRLMDAVSPSPDLEGRTEREICDMLHPKAKKRLRRTACIAAVAALLTFSMAFAAVQSSGILSRLFSGSGEPNQTAQEAVVRDSVQVSKDGLTLNMDEYLFDRNTLHLGWTISSERDTAVYCTTSYDVIYDDPADEQLAEKSFGGQLGASSSEEIGDGVLLRLSPERDAYSGYVSYGYAGAVQGTVNAKLTIRAYETDWSELPLSADSVWEFSHDEGQTAEMETDHQIGLTTGGMTRIAQYPAYEAALNRLLESGMEFDAACEAALTECGVFTELTTLELSISVDPSRAAAPRFTLDGERRFELEDSTVILKGLTVNAASTIIEYDLITARPVDTETYGGHGVSLLVLDQNGESLSEKCALDMYGRQLADENGDLVDEQGRTHWQITVSGNPLPESVTSLTFVDSQILRREEGESSGAYFRRILENSDLDNSFTVEMN